MLMVEEGEVPQHQACREEEEAWVHSWDYLLHSWTAIGGWQAGPEMCCHFCLLEGVVGEGLGQKKRQHLVQYLTSYITIIISY